MQRERHAERQSMRAEMWVGSWTSMHCYAADGNTGLLGAWVFDGSAERSIPDLEGLRR